MHKVTVQCHAAIRLVLLPGHMDLLEAGLLMAVAVDSAAAGLVVVASMGEDGSSSNGLKVFLQTNYSQASGRSVHRTLLIGRRPANSQSERARSNYLCDNN